MRASVRRLCNAVVIDVQPRRLALLVVHAAQLLRLAVPDAVQAGSLGRGMSWSSMLVVHKSSVLRPAVVMCVAVL